MLSFFSMTSLIIDHCTGAVLYVRWTLLQGCKSLTICLLLLIAIALRPGLARSSIQRSASRPCARLDR